MTELQQARYEWREKIAKILEKFVKDHPVSEAFVETSTENEFFEDSCEFVALRSDISQLAVTLRNINKYSKIYE